jgi:hypothetical protein
MMETKNIDESLGNDDLFGSFGEQDPFFGDSDTLSGNDDALSLLDSMIGDNSTVTEADTETKTEIPESEEEHASQKDIHACKDEDNASTEDKMVETDNEPSEDDDFFGSSSEQDSLFSDSKDLNGNDEALSLLDSMIGDESTETEAEAELETEIPEAEEDNASQEKNETDKVEVKANKKEIQSVQDGDPIADSHPVDDGKSANNDLDFFMSSAADESPTGFYPFTTSKPDNSADDGNPFADMLDTSVDSKKQTSTMGSGLDDNPFGTSLFAKDKQETAGIDDDNPFASLNFSQSDKTEDEDDNPFATTDTSNLKEDNPFAQMMSDDSVDDNPFSSNSTDSNAKSNADEEDDIDEFFKSLI